MDSIRRTFPAHIPLYACGFFSIVLIAAVLKAYGIAPRFDAAKIFLGAFAIFIGIIAFLIVALEIFQLAFNGFPADPLQYVTKRLIDRICAEDRIGNAFHSITILFPLLAAFVTFKGAIALVHPFGWDSTLSNADRVIGFGHQPWQLLQPLLGHPPITMFLAYAYYVWFYLLFAYMAAQIFARQGHALRMQFLIAMIFAFFLGGCVAAVIFSSAGPCYFAHLNLGFNPYSAQLTYLREIGHNSLPSVAVQDALWKDFSRGTTGEGVSAMPSMHVIVAVVIGLFGWRKGGLSAIVLPVFALLITLASVHLAWHYAIDGIAGIFLALLFWFTAGRIVCVWEKYLAHHSAGSQTPYETVSASVAEG